MNFFNYKNFSFIRGIFLRTCLFFIASYFVFHFLNGSISYAALEGKRELVKEKELLLSEKKKELEFKYLLIKKIKNVEYNLDLLDELVKHKLGYSSEKEVLFTLN
tara:strand:+ start:4978 stop:5292 length:315 start_codon:yes stop_codon:yes gene_type:complete